MEKRRGWGWGGGRGGVKNKGVSSRKCQRGTCRLLHETLAIGANYRKLIADASACVMIRVYHRPFLKSVRRDQNQKSEVDIKLSKRDKSSTSSGRECEKINKMRKTPYDLDRKRNPSGSSVDKSPRIVSNRFPVPIITFNRFHILLALFSY